VTAGFGGLSPTGSVDQMGQLFDPTTAHYVNGGAVGSGVVETRFPNNVIPFSRMDPSNYRHTTIPSFKIDQNVSSKIKVSGYYSQTYTYSPNANGFPEVLSPATPQNTRSQTVRINFDDTLTPTLLLHPGAGLLYDGQNQYPPFNNAGQIFTNDAAD